MKVIPYGRQDISDADIDAVIEVLRSDFITQGPCIPKFEKAVSAYCSVRHATAVTNATSALHIACMALELGEGDWLWTSPNSFVASSNCALYCRANVDFVDIDPRTYNMDVGKLEEKLMRAQKAGNLPKIVVPVHYAGQSPDMESVSALAQRFGFKVIEDASHAIGAAFKAAPVGNCEYSDITVFSFHPVKIITSGEGGMAVTNDANIHERLQLLRSHGITSDNNRMSLRSEAEIWNYQQIELGFNFRMTDIQAALGLSQLSSLDEKIARRKTIAEFYNEALADMPLTIPWQSPDTRSSFHLYPLRLHLSSIARSQPEVFRKLRDSGVLVNLHYIPIYLHPYYAKLGFEKGYCPESEAFFREAVTIPMYPTLSGEELERVVSSLKEALT